MGTKTITAECLNCESSYDMIYTEELVSEEYPEFCPFCGETIESLTEEEEDNEDDDSDEDKWE